jgi:hypothetical protein
MATFLEAMNQREWDRAIATLHLQREGFSDDVIATRGRELAAELKAVIDRVAFVQLEEMPEDLGERSSYVWETVDGIPVALERVGEGEWLFSRETLDRLPDLWEAVAGRDVVEGVEEAPQTPAMWIRDRMGRPSAREASSSSTGSGWPSPS